MELRDYLRVARRQWWVVALTVVAAMAIATAYTARTRPLYASAMQFFVATGNVEGSSALEGSMFATNRLKTYEAVLTGERLAKLIAAGDGTDLSPAEVQERISVVTDSATVLIDVTVEDAVRERAQLIATDRRALFTAEVAEESGVRPGDRVSLAVDPGRLHFFDRETGASLRESAVASAA